MRNQIIAAFGVSSLLLTACIDRVVPEKRIERITITTPPAKLDIGSSVQLSASAFSEGDEPFDVTEFTWSSSDVTIATVSSTGLVLGISAGLVRIWVEAGGHTSFLDFSVVQGPAMAVSTRELAFENNGPPTQTIQITNRGHSLVAGLNVGPVVYRSGNGWMTSASFSSTVAPSSLTIEVSPSGLAVGTYLANITLIGNANGLIDSSIVLSITMRVEPLLLLDVVTGYNHGCARKTIDQLLCWGVAGSGNLGGSAGNTQTQPTLVSSGIAFTQVVTGEHHSCALTPSNDVYCWGGNGFGQLGIGSTFPTTAPTRIAGSLKFLNISAGGGYTCGVTVDHAGFCWGSQTGDGTGIGSQTPVAISGNLSLAETASSSNHACARTTAGEIYCWGQNLAGELGDGTTLSRNVPVKAQSSIVFTKVVVSVNSTCGLDQLNQAYCWGSNLQGQLGNGTTTSSVVPVLVGGGFSFVELVAGRNHACGRTITGTTYCWGQNTNGQIGIGTTSTAVTTPSLVGGGLILDGITAGTAHTCGHSRENVVYCWGQNSGGQLGDGTTTRRLTPTVVGPPQAGASSGVGVSAPSSSRGAFPPRLVAPSPSAQGDTLGMSVPQRGCSRLTRRCDLGALPPGLTRAGEV